MVNVLLTKDEYTERRVQKEGETSVVWENLCTKRKTKEKGRENKTQEKGRKEVGLRRHVISHKNLQSSGRGV